MREGGQDRGYQQHVTSFSSSGRRRRRKGRRWWVEEGQEESSWIVEEGIWGRGKGIKVLGAFSFLSLTLSSWRWVVEVYSCGDSLGYT